ncbi:50S ribosomal protein L17 [Striga asiatica]|uniref:50S ribosomal protein L17 n=1 Tax=Striga asiatica TaxID=4170 RepID=A0A5A7QGN4_STRAF|nr:50S ribosomal protein L17 [Striga asiatica]
MPHKRYLLEAGPSTCKKHLLVPKAEIEKIEQRLRALEEEGEVLKGAFLESMEERAKLTTEINDSFNSLAKRGSNCGALSDRSVQIISLVKEKRAGLLQILWEEPNPSIVKRGLRAKAIR